MVKAVALPTRKVLDFPITALRLNEQIQTILQWANEHKSKTVCVANVHMLMEAHWNPEFAGVLKNADVVTPDGMPLVWMMKKLGATSQDRVAGLDILASICESAPKQNISLFFLGSQKQILSGMRSRLKEEYPELHIAAMEPLPFRPLTESEDEALIKKINEENFKNTALLVMHSTEDQQLYTRKLMKELAEYIEEKRQSDLQLVNYALRELKSNTQAQQEETNIILAKLIDEWSQERK